MTIVLRALFLFLFQMNFVMSQTADTCTKWFHALKFKPSDRDCALQCTSSQVDMETFYCTSRCAELCEEPFKVQLLHNLAFYPGLTDQEKVIFAKMPKTSWKAFRIKNRAEKATFMQFKRNIQYDESDTFRHFVWAGLLYWELGLKNARLFTEAHEMSSQNEPQDKAMDLANNRAGILAAQE